MEEKKKWIGVAPTPKVFAVLDLEEIAVLALLSWSAAANRPVLAEDIAALPDRDDKPLGPSEARQIVERLAALKIVSVLGMNTPRPLSVFLGGFQPKAKPAFRPSYPTAPSGARIETGLLTTGKTPAFVIEESQKLRDAQAVIEQGEHGLDLVGAATERLRILNGRIALYRRWLVVESKHPRLREFLDKKVRAVSEMEFQLERAAAKQRELNEAETEATAC